MPIKNTYLRNCISKSTFQYLNVDTSLRMKITNNLFKEKQSLKIKHKNLSMSNEKVCL